MGQATVVVTFQDGEIGKDRDRRLLHWGALFVHMYVVANDPYSLGPKFI